MRMKEFSHEAAQYNHSLTVPWMPLVAKHTGITILQIINNLEDLTSLETQVTDTVVFLNSQRQQKYIFLMFWSLLN